MPHLNGEILPSNVKAVATYDIGSYGEDLWLPLTDVGLTETALTFSTATVTRDTSDSNQPVDTYPRVFSDTDAGLLLNEGNDTAFNQTYTLDPDMTAIIYKISLNFCAILTCSAYTNGGLSLVSLVTVAVLNVKAVSVRPTSLNGSHKSSPYDPISYVGIALTCDGCMSPLMCGIFAT